MYDRLAERPNEAISFVYFMLRHFERADMAVILNFRQLDEHTTAVLAEDLNFVPREDEE